MRCNNHKEHEPIQTDPDRQSMVKMAYAICIFRTFPDSKGTVELIQAIAVFVLPLDALIVNQLLS